MDRESKRLVAGGSGGMVFHFPIMIEEAVLPEGGKEPSEPQAAASPVRGGSHQPNYAMRGQQATSYSFRETMPDDGVQRIPPVDGYRRDLKDEVIKRMRDEVLQFADNLAKKYGMRCNSVNYNQGEESRYGADPSHVNMVMSLSLVNQLGLDKFARDLLAHAPDFGLDASMYSQIVQYENAEYLISGLDVARGKVRLTSSEKAILMAPEFLLDIMGSIEG
ncbi:MULTISPECIES: hypothetical protein [Aeromonas]|uniref:Uncharacterized protein n=1 Tax=Aeromonas caviae TaxID=648 RepID=A0AAJ6CT64_AERCA|nr:hypothetical protein [Aeromonas caviae]RWT73701.1 hypothetical protein DN604_16560 [Aeromonas caviae]WFG00220.1 hypothetical protein P5S46_22255 [Aeromonas caviae]WVM47851.1 hypothetical protein V0242_24940 [Aeromonas hydrophila]